VTVLMLILCVPVLAGALLTIAYLAMHHTLRKVFKALNPAWLFFTGLPVGDGVSRTNATWLQRSRGPKPVLHNSGHAIWWHHLPRLHRAGIRTGATLAFLGVLCGLAADLQVTLIILAVLAAAGLSLLAWHVVYRARNWKHERHYVRPLEGTLIRKIPVRPVSIEIERADNAVKSVAIEWPPNTQIEPEDQKAVLQAVTTRLAIEAPDPAWRVKGRERYVRFTQSEPPPSYVRWEGAIEAAVKRAALDELVFGIGKRDAVNSAKYGQSPHLQIPGDSGGGKSNLAAFLLIQEMLRGSLIFNLDPKWISHLWLQDLPNVINAHEAPDLHLALCWLGKELLRRTKAAYYSAQGTGRVRGNVGCRIIVLAEELNYGMPGMKEHWREIREKGDPKQSPAISALSALACAGRASDMHEWLIAQLMTVESTGVKDSTIRTNAGIKAMVRCGRPGWDMSVGKHVVMPSMSATPGRIQLVTGDVPRETQVPYLHLDDKDEEVSEAAVKWARELVVSGTVAQIPSGPEGIPPQLWPASVLKDAHLALPAGQDGLSTMTSLDVTVSGTVVVTLAEAVSRGIVGPTIQAVRKARSRDDGFPEPVGERPGTGHPALLYDVSDLHAWSRSRREDRKVAS
jgi:hypothetical protein